MKKAIILICSGITLTFLANAQDCRMQLENANRAFYDGNFEEIEVLLGGCYSSLDGGDREEALELLINASLMLNEDERADGYMNELLSLNPIYQPNSSDLVEFQRLHETAPPTIRQ